MCGLQQTIDLDMALNSRSGPDDIMVLSGSTGHTDQHGPSGTLLLDTNMVSRGWPAPRHLYSPRWLYKWTLTQTLAAAGLWSGAPV